MTSHGDDHKLPILAQAVRYAYMIVIQKDTFQFKIAYTW